MDVVIHRMDALSSSTTNHLAACVRWWSSRAMVKDVCVWMCCMCVCVFMVREIMFCEIVCVCVCVFWKALLTKPGSCDVYEDHMLLGQWEEKIWLPKSLVALFNRSMTMQAHRHTHTHTHTCRHIASLKESKRMYELSVYGGWQHFLLTF